MTDVTEIADGIYRLSTFVPDVGPTGFTFNQFLVDADEPLLFHTGLRGMFPLVSEAVGTGACRSSALRWITFGHVEADECGAMNQFLAAAPNAQVAHGALGLHGVAQRPRRPAAASARPTARCSTSAASACATSTRRTSRTAGTRTCSSRRPPARCSAATSSRQVGAGPAITGDDLVEPRRSRPRTCSTPTCLTPQTAPTIRDLADLDAGTARDHARLVVRGRLRAALRALADDYDRRLAAGMGSTVSA